MNTRRLWIVLLLCLIGSSGAIAQRFSINLQGGAATSSLGGRSQFEASYDPIAGLSFGARLGLQISGSSGVELSLAPFALYRVFIYGDGVWSLTGYAGAQVGAYYTPNRPATAAPVTNNEIEDGGGSNGSGSGSSGGGSGSSGSSNGGGGGSSGGTGSSGSNSGESGSNSGKDGSSSGKSDDGSNEKKTENEGRRSGREPRGDSNFNPTQTLEFTALALSGLDGAYYADERLSLYFGIELDLRALPVLEPVSYPYLELDYLLVDNLTGAVGGYLSLRPSSAAYLIYANLFYDFSSQLGAKLEVAFSGTISGYLRLTIRL
jgi:hypothetical protein